MTGTDAYRRLRREVHDILEVGGDAHHMGRVVNGFIITLIFLNAITFAADTVPELAERYGWEFKAFNVFSVIVFTIEYVLRVWSAVEIPMLSRPLHGQARLRFAMRPMMIIDLLAFALALPDRSPAPQGIQVFRLLMLVGYSPALQTLGRIVADEYRALLGALLVVLILLLFASAGMYLLERDVQPDKFGSKLLYTRTFMPGVPMVRAHDAGDAMFIIASGEAVVEISPSRRVVLKEGDFFGEMALLEHRRHKHDVVAKTRCRLYVLDSGSLARLDRRHPERMESIRKMAEARAVDDEPAHREDRKRKVGAKG